MENIKVVKDLQENERFWFEHELYSFNFLVGNDSARVTLVESDQRTFISRHAEVKVVK